MSKVIVTSIDRKNPATANASAHAPAGPVLLSTKLARLIDQLRQPFADYASLAEGLAETRASLAPRFMKTCHAWQEETGGTFVQFVRVLVPDLPMKRDEYRATPVFQAADYLRRLIGREPTAPRVDATTGKPLPPAISPLEALSRVMASILPLLGGASPELWSAFAAELHWSDLQIKRLQTLTTSVEPLLEAHVPRSAGSRALLKLVS